MRLLLIVLVLKFETLPTHPEKDNYKEKGTEPTVSLVIFFRNSLSGVPHTCRILFNWSMWSLPGNRTCPVSSSAMMQPTDQMSTTTEGAPDTSQDVPSGNGTVKNTLFVVVHPI